VTGLSRPDATALLHAHAPGLPVPVREQVLREAAGNPLALRELGAAHLAADRTGRVDLAGQVGPLAVPRRIQEAFRAQIVELPASTGLALVVAAADTAAELDEVLRVAVALGAPADALGPAEAAGLVEVAAGRVGFRHPLVRAAAYQGAPHHVRAAVHRAFADALPADDDRRTWHLATATTGPDEEVAAALERAAERAHHRGGAMAVSVAFERAGKLSADPRRRAQRMVSAARAAYDAGKQDRAARLAGEAAALATDPVARAEALHVQAQVEYERTSPRADAVLALRAADLLLDGADPAAAAEQALLILTEVIGAGRDAAAHDLVREGVARLARLPLPADPAVRDPAAAQLGWGRLFAGEPEHAAAPMRAMVAAARAGSVDPIYAIMTGFSGVMLADDEGATAVMGAMLAGARRTGSMLWVPYSMEVLGLAQALGGDLAAARVTVAEALVLAGEQGMRQELVMLRALDMWLAAVGGEADRVAELSALLPAAGADTHGVGMAFAGWARGLCALGAGRPAEAVDELLAACTGPARRDVLVRAVPDLVEAALRAGRTAEVVEPVDDLRRWGAHAGTGRAQALALRVRALLDDGDGAEAAFTAAIELQRRPDAPWDRARTHLGLGGWLRRRRRRADARTHLAEAAALFERLDARPWAAQARAELAALGEGAVEPASPAAPRLTPQELQVVRLAATGLSNKDIGAQLFLSPRTVGHHLYRAYPKLGVTRRIELAQLDL
jgi:DNA-binding CsgD family transcriptional regulator